MDKLDLNQALKHIKDSEAVYIVNNSKPTYFFFSNDMIQAVSPQSRFAMSIDLFRELYEKEVFYLYNNSEEGVDDQKDSDYYSWKAKGVN